MRGADLRTRVIGLGSRPYPLGFPTLLVFPGWSQLCVTTGTCPPHHMPGEPCPMGQAQVRPTGHLELLRAWPAGLQPPVLSGELAARPRISPGTMSGEGSSTSRSQKDEAG